MQNSLNSDVLKKVASKEKAETTLFTQETDSARSLDDQYWESIKQHNKESNDTHKLRLKYTGRIFWLICIWLACVVVAVFMSGFSGFGFNLSDTILIAFISSTTITVVGLFAVIAKWMFPQGQQQKGS